MYIAICLLCLAIVLLALVFPAFFKPSECGQASRPEKGGGSGEAEFPYQAIDKLFSPAERSLLGVLDQVVGSQYRVFGKVRVADLAAVKPGLTKAARQGALNRIASKHFDYVICQATDLVVLCAVSLMTGRMQPRPLKRAMSWSSRCAKQSA